jgi:hypothetical protein
MPTPFDTIKARVRDAIGEVLRGDVAGARPARVTVTRTVRRGAATTGVATLGKLYRLLDDVKVLIGDLDRVVGEAKGFFPTKRKKSKSAARARRSGAKKRAAPAGRKAQPAPARRRRPAARPALRTERTTITTEGPVRNAATA